MTVQPGSVWCVARHNADLRCPPPPSPPNPHTQTYSSTSTQDCRKNGMRDLFERSDPRGLADKIGIVVFGFFVFFFLPPWLSFQSPEKVVRGKRQLATLELAWPVWPGLDSGQSKRFDGRVSTVDRIFMKRESITTTLTTCQLGLLMKPTSLACFASCVVACVLRAPSCILISRDPPPPALLPPRCAVQIPPPPRLSPQPRRVVRWALFCAVLCLSSCGCKYDAHI